MFSREDLYDVEHKPRLAFARSYFLGYSDRDPDLEGLEKFYTEWRDYNEYIVVQKQSDNLRIEGEIEKETIAVKCSKRGNDVYWWRVWKRIKKLYDLKEQTLFDPHSSVKLSNVLFATLTNDVKRSRISEAWETEGEDFNTWIRNIRKKFGWISYFRSLEASKRGYPHIHILMIFHDYKFQVIDIKGKYRILEKEEFEKSWHSFVDVQAIRRFREGVKYVTKYLTKTKNDSKTQVLTLALCWLFRKRSFAISGDLHEVMEISITHGQMIQTNLMGEEVTLDVVWVFIGIFSAEKLGITLNEWRKTITDRAILNEILT
ncbi:MAG: hypothetical protein V1850_03510 [Candidatus Bathyarchaeota archaeon]